MAATHEPAGHVRAHPAEADHSDLHALRIPVWVRLTPDPTVAQLTTTAVPLIVTISMLALVPTVS